MKSDDKLAGLYEPLPKALGGQGSRPVAAAVGALLPYPPGSKHPNEETLNTAIRSRALLLDSGGKQKETPLQTENIRKRRKGRPAGGKVQIPKEEQRYELYVPLMTLWKDYATKLLGEERLANYGDRILRMDLHGAPVEVVRSLDPGLVGVTGILVAETARTIIVVTKQNRALTVPKKVSVVRTRIGKASVEVSLPALQFRAAERSARKIKKRHLPFM